MADRIFGGIALAIVLAYGIIAFTIIRAPFQYDPLGPESWPRILSVASGLCCLAILVRPGDGRFEADARTWARLGLVVILLSLYATIFEPLGFVISTTLFCAAFARILGSGWPNSLAFGIGVGVPGYAICTYLLDLNLPAGVLSEWL